MHRARGGDGPGWQGRHPAEKLVPAFGWMLTAIILDAPAGALVALLALVVLLGPARVAPRTVVRRASALLVFMLAASLAVIPTFVVDGTGVHLAGIDVAAGTAAFQRALGGGAAMLLLGCTTSLPDLLRTLRSAGLPESICDLGLAMHRMVFVLFEERTRLGTALQLRGGGLRWRARWRSVVTLTVALLGRALGRADRMERALQLRAPAGLVPSLPTHAPLRRAALVRAGVLVALPPTAWWWLQ